jgi:outer membrane protein OmpA-like peptidoglycan-associated protein
MKKTWMLIAAGLLPATAAAQVNLEQFRPQMDGRGLFAAESPRGLAPLELAVGVALHYARDPLHPLAPGGRGGALIAGRLTNELLLALGLASWLEVGLAVPLVVVNDTYEGAAGVSGGAGPGPVRLQLKFRILNEADHGIGLAFVPRLGFASAATSGLLADSEAAFSPMLVFERHLGRGRVLFNVGYTARKEGRILGQGFDDELFWRLGFGFRASRRVELALELGGATAASDVFGPNEILNPFELTVGARIKLGRRAHLALGFGPGLSGGYGTPVFRTLAALTVTSREEPPLRPALPDWDGDGVPDRVDRCPKQWGTPENQGCPPSDRDNDGVPDDEDRCPLTPGPIEHNGCPPDLDTDRDGTPDSVDDCPRQPGKGPRGCPRKGAQLRRRTIRILDRVRFGPQSADLRPESHAILDAVAALLQQHPQVALAEIQGHTDDTGDDQFNLKLSQERAEAVKRYLVSKGVAEGRLAPHGYGEDRPIRPVTERMTAAEKEAARAMNRRVQFVILRQ